MNRYHARALSVIALAVCSTHRAQAAPVTTSATKTIIWSFNAAPMATDLNVYTWNLTATAKSPGNAIDNQAKMSDPANPITWPANAALAAVDKTSGKADSGGTTAQTTVTFSASAPIMLAPGSYQLTTNMVFKNVVDDGNNKAPITMDTTSTASMFIKGGTAQRAVITKPDEKVVLSPQLKGGTVNFSFDKAKGMWIDPVSVSVADISTGSTVASSILGNEDGSYTGAGTFGWDSTGITLTAPNDGLSSSELDFNIGGSWITANQAAGTVTLQNGVFLATGAFASLPWVLDNPADPQQATLGAAYLPDLEMDYQVPASLLNSTDNYQETLTQTATFTDAVPEPGSLTLVSVAMLGSSRRSRHRRLRRRLDKLSLVKMQQPRRR